MTSKDTSRVASSHKKRFKTPMPMTALEIPTIENLEKRFPPCLFVVPSQRARRSSPSAPLRRRAGLTSHLCPQTVIRDDLSDGGDEGCVGTRIVEISCLAFVHHLPGRTTPGGEHGQSGSEGFDHSNPQRLRGRREQESVGGGERGRELLALQHSRKDRRRVRVLLFEVPARGSVSDEGETHSGYFAENDSELTDVLLMTEASYVEKKPLRRVAVRQPDPPIFRELVGVEAPGINTLWPQVQPLDTLVGEVPERRLRGAEVEGGPVVQLPGVPARGAVEEPEPVEAGVGGDVRVVGSHQRDVQAPGVERSSPSEHERVYGMDQLGPEAAQRGAHARVYGGELYLGIGRERHAGDAVDRNSLVRTRSFAVLWGDQEHLVTHHVQLFYGVPEPGDHAIGGREERLGKVRDAHSPASRGRTRLIPHRSAANVLPYRFSRYRPAPASDVRS